MGTLKGQGGVGKPERKVEKGQKNWEVENRLWCPRKQVRESLQKLQFKGKRSMYLGVGGQHHGPILANTAFLLPGLL